MHGKYIIPKWQVHGLGMPWVYHTLQACLENSCVICLGHLDDDARGALKGAPAARPLAQLVDREGQLLCWMGWGERQRTCKKLGESRDGHWYFSPLM